MCPRSNGYRRLLFFIEGLDPGQILSVFRSISVPIHFSVIILLLEVT